MTSTPKSGRSMNNSFRIGVCPGMTGEMIGYMAETVKKPLGGNIITVYFINLKLSGGVIANV